MDLRSELDDIFRAVARVTGPLSIAITRGRLQQGVLQVWGDILVAQGERLRRLARGIN